MGPRQRLLNISGHFEVGRLQQPMLQPNQASNNTEKENIDRMVKRWSGQRTLSTPRKNRPRAETCNAKESYASISDGTGSHVMERKRTAIVDSCDVLVVGGGPAGLSAALGASRAGADTIVVERFGCFGGVITTVGMETMGWYRYEGTTDSEGIGREMEALARRLGGTTKFPYNDSDCLDAEQFKLIADGLVEQNGIRPYLHTWVVDVIKDGNKIKGVITESKSGRQAIVAKRVIDCTGDADVANFCGDRFTFMNTNDHMGCTTVFNVAGVDKEKFLRHTHDQPKTYADWGGSWTQHIDEKDAGLGSPFLSLQSASGEDIEGSWSSLSAAGEATNLNLVHMKGYDCTNAQDLTKAEMEGRKKTMKALDALRSSVEGFENAKLRNYGMTVGVRDTRKIVGRYNLTKEDVFNEARFEDSIGYLPSSSPLYIDVKAPSFVILRNLSLSHP